MWHVAVVPMRDLVGKLVEPDGLAEWRGEAHVDVPGYTANADTDHRVHVWLGHARAQQVGVVAESFK